MAHRQGKFEPLPKRAIADTLAAAMVAGPLEADGIVQRGGQLLGRRPQWLILLAERVRLRFATGPRPRQREVAEFLHRDRGFGRAVRRLKLRLVRQPMATFMAPRAPADEWTLPVLRNPDELAHWLGLSFGELLWFADLRSWETQRSAGPLRHYHYKTLTKRFGTVRLIEVPKPRLKAIQRKILRELLAAVPPHAAAHGFRAGHSIQTFAAPHIGQQAVLRMDLQDFFPSIRVARVAALFRTLGYPEPVADLLAGFGTNAAPLDIWESAYTAATREALRIGRWRYVNPHLPQGAPTSPALANLCAYRLDCRLAGLAASAGARYTRYADDLAFSGPAAFARSAARFQVHVAATVLEEGFEVHHRKTRIMRQGVRQYLTGMVVNQRLNIPRPDYDRLKATLTNCIRQGPAGQNRTGVADYRAHLNGQVAFVESVHAGRGRRLRDLFEQIAW